MSNRSYIGIIIAIPLHIARSVFKVWWIFDAPATFSNIYNYIFSGSHMWRYAWKKIEQNNGGCLKIEILQNYDESIRTERKVLETKQTNTLQNIKWLYRMLSILNLEISEIVIRCMCVCGKTWSLIVTVKFLIWKK